MTQEESIQSESMRSLIGDSLIFGGVGAISGFTLSCILKNNTKHKIIFSASGLALGIGLVLFLRYVNSQDIMGAGDVSADAKNNRNITFSK